MRNQPLSVGWLPQNPLQGFKNRDEQCPVPLDRVTKVLEELLISTGSFLGGAEAWDEANQPCPRIPVLLQSLDPLPYL